MEPVYETLPGWKQSTVGIVNFDKLPPVAQDYIRYIEKATGVPVDMVSTGNKRSETILLRDPFKAGRTFSFWTFPARRPAEHGKASIR